MPEDASTFKDRFINTHQGLLYNKDISNDKTSFNQELISLIIS